MPDIISARPESASNGVWPSIAGGLRADALDCVQTTVSLMADYHYGAGAHLALGAAGGLPAMPGPLSYQVRRSVPDRLAEARELLGLRVTASWSDVTGAHLCSLAADHGPLMVVADAYDLPWLPYRGHEHMEHSFLVTTYGRERLLVVDAYHNDTAWGPARPGQWEMPAASLGASLAAGAEAMTVAAVSLPPLDPAAVLASNAHRLAQRAPAEARYLAEAQACLGTPAGVAALVLDIWLIARAWLLHTAWLASQGLDDAASAVDGRARDWQALATHSYIGLRRVRRGQPGDPNLAQRLTELMADDRAVVEQIARPSTALSGSRADPVRTMLVDLLCRALGVGPEAVRSARELRELPGFNSFRLVDVIEQAESRLGVRLAPSRISASSLGDLGALCEIFTDAGSVGSGAPL
jgi:hypothetical protein